MSDLDDVSDTDSINVSPRESSQYLYHNPSPPAVGPYLEITEQPQSRGFRFRYACEGKSHGGLQGINSRREKKSYPSIKIIRYKGPAKIVVSLVTDEKLPKPHAHELIGKNCANGVCSVVIKGDSNMSVSFPNLGVRHVTKKSVQKILTERIIELMKVDKMMSGELGQDSENITLSAREQALAAQQALLQAKDMPLNAVRLSFQAYLQDSFGHYTQVLPSIISNPIYDSKAPCASLLKICRMDKVGGCCTGNEEVFLLCDKVQKDDIAVRFFEQDEEGNVKWEEYGNFAPHDVHRQYAIVFRTPSYLSTKIERPTNVHVQLKRFSDNEVSDPKTFTYFPQQTDLEDIQKKRKKLIPNFYEEQNIRNTGLSSYPVTVNGTSTSYQNNNTNMTTLTAPSEHHHHPPIPSFVRNQLELEADDICDNISVLSHMLFKGPPDKFSLASGDQFEVPLPREAEKFQLVEKTVVPDDSINPPSREESPQPGELRADDDDETGLVDDTVEGTDDRKFISKALHKTACSLADALQGYSSTGDVRRLLHPARRLIGHPNDDGDNAIHLAVIHEQSLAGSNLLSVVSTMTDEESINDHNYRRQSPLYLSVVTKQTKFLDMLLSAGADCWTLDKVGNTLLHLSVRSGNEDCLEKLLNKWNDIKIGWKPVIDALNYDGYSAVHLAIIHNQFTCLKLLLDLGRANVNLVDGRSGRSALHHAVDMNNLAFVVHLVLECNADVSLPQFDGNTALHMAVSSNKLDIAAVLMAAGADPDAHNHDLEKDGDDEDVEQGEAAHSGALSEVLVDNDEDEEKEEVKGATPREYAQDNPKMMLILDGVSYSSTMKLDNPRSTVSKSSLYTVHHELESRLKSVYDSGIDSIKIQSFAGGTSKNRSVLGIDDPSQSASGHKSDLRRLDAMVRMRLAKLLDPVRRGSDWRELATRLEFGPLSNGFQIQKSPTKALLDNYEEQGGTCGELQTALLNMNRGDCVKLMEDVVPPPKGFTK